MKYFRKEYQESKLRGKDAKVNGIFNPMILNNYKIQEMMKKSFNLLDTDLEEFLENTKILHEGSVKTLPDKPHTITSVACYFMGKDNYDMVNANLLGADESLLAAFEHRPRIIVSMGEKTATIKGWSDAGDFEITTLNAVDTEISMLNIKCNTTVVGGELRDQITATFDDNKYMHTSFNANDCIVVKEQPTSQPRYYFRDFDMEM